MESSEISKSAIKIGDKNAGKGLSSCGAEVSDNNELETDKTNNSDGEGKYTAHAKERNTTHSNSAVITEVPVGVHRRIDQESTSTCTVGQDIHSKLVEKASSSGLTSNLSQNISEIVECNPLREESGKKSIVQTKSTCKVDSVVNSENTEPEPINSSGSDEDLEVGTNYINYNLNTDPKYLRNTLKREAQAKLDPLEGSSQHYIVNTNDVQEDLTPSAKRRKVDIYAPDIGPQMYSVPASLVTQPIITNQLPKVFQHLPIHGKPSGPNLEEWFREQIKKFVGFGLNDEEFEELEKDCCPELLKTGKELVMRTKLPVLGLLKSNVMSTPDLLDDPNQPEETTNRCIIKKHKFRGEMEVKNVLKMKFKYRGLRLLPPLLEENPDNNSEADNDIELDPGKDVIYHVRIYRPFLNSAIKERSTRVRACVFLCDVLLCGRNCLTALRDRFVCHNDFDMRVDVSNNPDRLPTTNAKDVFPSGFLFINNVFYVDNRLGCIDTSRVVREWAIKKKLGDFPVRNMCDVKLEDMVLKLGYPEVYVHQGDCEHVFVFSQLRLLSPRDPLRLSSYPYSTAVSHNQTVYCTTCAEYCTKWIVVGCDRVPFDPAFFCDTCFRQYLYKDGQKIGDFKAYSYRGNALNYLRPR